MDPEQYKGILKVLYSASRPYHDLIEKAEGGGATYDDILMRHPRKYRPARLALARLRNRIPLLRTIGVNFKIIARKR